MCKIKSTGHIQLKQLIFSKHTPPLLPSLYWLFKERINHPGGINRGCDENKITYKHLSHRLNVQDEFKVEMLISVSRSVLPSNGKHHSEIKKKGALTYREICSEERRHTA